jgi:hypothetical protein
MLTNAPVGPKSHPDCCLRYRHTRVAWNDGIYVEGHGLHNGNWGGYYSGLGLGAGFAIGATIAALPATAAAVSVAGNPYYYADGVYYAPQGGQYAVVAPPQGAVVASPPSSCSSVNLGNGGTGLDCGGAFYAAVPGGYQVIAPPVGATTWTLPDGAVDQNVNGVTYFSYGGAYYRPIYSGSASITRWSRTRHRIPSFQAMADAQLDLAFSVYRLTTMLRRPS